MGVFESPFGVDEGAYKKCQVFAVNDFSGSLAGGKEFFDPFELAGFGGVQAVAD